MSCDRTPTTLHGYFDNELDALGAAEFERHLTECPECSAALEGLKTFRLAINRAQLRHKAPAQLGRRVLADTHSSTPTSTIRRTAAAPSRWKWLTVAAALIFFAFAGWRMASIRDVGDSQKVLAAEAVDAHLRSLQPGHLSDVISTDQHTVKPWFDGKLDFAPPVRNFAEQGFPLEGGRLDVVHGRTVAALVYGRHKHLVSVFIWPTAETDATPRSGSKQGYQWITWRKEGMEYYAVSDTAASDLELLQRLFTD
jgi:anti-sigma factor RsiW